MDILNDIWVAVLAFLQVYILDLVSGWVSILFGDNDFQWPLE